MLIMPEIRQAFRDRGTLRYCTVDFHTYVPYNSPRLLVLVIVNQAFPNLTILSL